VVKGEVPVVADFGNQTRAAVTRVVPDSTHPNMRKRNAGPRTAKKTEKRRRRRKDRFT